MSDFEDMIKVHVDIAWLGGLNFVNFIHLGLGLSQA